MKEFLWHTVGFILLLLWVAFMAWVILYLKTSPPFDGHEVRLVFFTILMWLPLTSVGAVIALFGPVALYHGYKKNRRQSKAKAGE